MTHDHVAAPGVRRLASGTPPVLGLSALDAALEVFDGVGIGTVRAVSTSLTALFVDLVTAHVPEVEVVTPRDPQQRGSHVSVRHPAAYAVVQALIARGVVGDFREPDLARFGFAPLYVTHADVVEAVAHLVDLLALGEHHHPTYAVRKAVT